MAAAVECKMLSKSYGNQNVLNNIDLYFEENKIYGLLGRNGAGKSTLLNLIGCNILRNSGNIKILGEEVFENSNAIENICLVRENGFPVEDYRVEKIFELAKILYKNWDESFKDYLVKEFKLNTRKKYKNLSKGTKSIVDITIGLASRAKITIYDEPSSGLDAAAREKFYNLLLQDYENNKRTIIISTHLIDEVSSLFEEVVILNNGKVLIKEELSSLLQDAHFLSGKEENIIPFIKSKKIIHKELFGAAVIIGIIGSFSDEEMNVLREHNVDINPISLQKLFIYMTESENSEEGRQ